MLQNLSAKSLVCAINLVYPKHGDSATQYAEQLRVAQVDLARSVTALDEVGQVVGMALLGVRGERGWCGDAAVIPQFQNQKLGQALMRRLTHSSRQCGLKTLTLEVRDNNAPARHVYEQEGYAYTRRLNDYTATLNDLGWRTLQPPNDLHVCRAASAGDMTATLLRWYGTRFVAPPCWERELPSLLGQRHTALWTASDGGREVACLMGDWNDGKRLNIQLLGLTDEATPCDVRPLLATALRETGMKTLRIGLEPADSRAAEMLRDLGFGLDKELWEMVKTL